MASLPTHRPNADHDEWIERGRVLAVQRRDIDWALGDWMIEGREAGHIDQAGFDFLAENLGIAPKRLRTITRAAEEFPSHLRDASLTIEHHALVTQLPRDEQLELLKRAKEAHWSDDDLRKQVISHKVRSGRVEFLSQQEYDEHALIALQHDWNRASAAVREDFLEMARDANGGIIDV